MEAKSCSALTKGFKNLLVAC